MKYATRSYIGTRKVQEDCADSIVTENGIFAVVCDGIGSRSDGGASSRMAVECFLEEFRNGYSGSFPQFITKTAESVDRRVYERFGNNCGTTAVAVLVEDNKLYWLSIGDSRLYIIRGGRIRQMTTDHNYQYVLDLRRQKNLIDEEAYQRELKRSGQLASFIGMGGVDIVDVSMQPITLRSGDKLLLTTDGLYKPLGDEIISDIINRGDDPEKTADALLAQQQKCSCPLDNTTFTIVFIE